ncbi:MAG: tetratricopeptide (TPR) repeat protein [Pirellulaceae bacterium]|jgi:tetratricopeptide (TPR) repeat protein
MPDIPQEMIEETKPSHIGLKLSLAGIVVALLMGSFLFADWYYTLPEDTKPTFVGRNTCLECHQHEHKLWEGSHHDKAMDVAKSDTVLGDFNDATLEHFGITSKMFQQDGKYFVNTEGPDGNMADFEVKYVFGVEPLQQYMVEFDRHKDMPENEIARLQVLRVSWNTEKKEWFYLSPPDVDEKLEPPDDLHWTGITQCWNTTCAECHSTNLQKNFDVNTKTYHTTFEEIDVSCEECHGAGSVHVDLAKSKSLFWDRKFGYGLAKLKGEDPQPQLQMCAKCHSRRRVLDSNFRAGDQYHDFYGTDLLVQPLYHCDGQILDEVYVFGSFAQSKMYHKGIRCTDCHDPHTTKIKHPDNKLCTSCHAHAAGKYDTEGHHHHKTGTKGAQCVECHMPETTYMAVDPRRDHSLRVPRPDLSVKYNVPNACTGCHLDRSKLEPVKTLAFSQYADWVRAAAEGNEEVANDLAIIDKWSADKAKEWYGDKTPSTPHFADAFYKARLNQVEARGELLKLAEDVKMPDIVRATAIAELSRFTDNDTRKANEALLKDKSAQVRTAAIGHIEAVWRQIPSFTGQDLANRITPLLDDPARLVRVEAGRVLANLPQDIERIPENQAAKLFARIGGDKRQAMQNAIGEFKAAMMVSNDRAAAHMGLGILYESMRDYDSAESAYQAAIRVESGVTGPRANLAHLLETRIGDIQAQIQQVKDPNFAGQQFGKIQGYQERIEKLRAGELTLLERDSKLVPDLAPVQYRYGLAVYLSGDYEKAEKALVAAATLQPRTTQYLIAVALLFQKLKRYDEAIKYCNDAIAVRPDDRELINVLRSIQAERQSSR